MEIKVNKNQTRTAIYVRISTAQQKTDRQVVELKEYAKSHAITIDEDDIFIDVISGFKNGEIRPQYSVLKQKVEAGLYDQILFSEFSRLDRKPSNLLKSIEYYQSKGVHLYFKKQNIWIRDKSDISTQIMVSVLAVMSPQKHKIYTSVSGCRMRKIKSGLEALDFVLDSTVLNLSFIYDNYILVGAVGPFKGFFAAGFVDGHCGEVFGFELHKFFRADFFATHNIDVVDIDICCLACF